MANDTKVEKVQLEVSANGNPARKELNRLDNEAQKLKNTMRDLAAAGKKNTEEYKNAAASLKEVEQQMNKVRASIDISKMTMRELNAELRKLKGAAKDIEPMSKAYWENKKAMDAVIARQKELRTGMSSFAQSIAKYKDQIVFGGMAAGALALYTGISNIIKVNVEFERSLKNLQAITGVGAQDLKFYASAAKDIGLSTTTSAEDAVEAFKLIASAKPDLLNAKEALVAVTKEAIHLANASGLSLPEAATRLTDAMNQFSAPAREAGKYVNILAEGARLSAAEVPDITSALLEFGVAAKSSNVSISESVALIEAMAEKGVKGAEAGTKLRNVLAKGFSPKGLDKAAIADLEAMGVNLDVLSNKNLSLQVRLQELAKIKDNDIALTHVFGLENKIAAQVILENTERVNELSVALGKDGLTTAIDQAAVNMDTLGSAANRFTNTWNAIMTDEEGGLNGALKSFVKWGTEAIKTMDFLLAKANFGSKKDKAYNRRTLAGNKVVEEYSDSAKDMTADELAKELVEKQRTLNYLINQRNSMPYGDEANAITQQIVVYSKMKAVIYENLKQIQEAELTAAKKSEALTLGNVQDAKKKIDQVEGHIKKIKELHSEFFKLTGYETEKEFFEAMEKENLYQEKLAASRAAEPAERDAQNNIDEFGFPSLNAWGESTGNADVESDKEAAERAKREAKEEEERQAFLKLEKDKQDAQAETFENWVKREDEKIKKTLNGLQVSLGFFRAFDNFKTVRENAELARLDENSARAKEIRIAQAKREKNLALQEAIIATALGVAQNLGNPIAAGVAAATGLLQIATIQNTEIPEAKYGIKRIPGNKHSNGGMDVIDPKTGRAVLNIEKDEALIPGATVDANEPLIDAMLNNYGKPIGIDWLYKNLSASIKGFTSNSTSTIVNNNTVNNQTSNSSDGIKELSNSIKRMEQSILQSNKGPINLSMYELRKKQKEIDIIERNAGTF